MLVIETWGIVGPSTNRLGVASTSNVGARHPPPVSPSTARRATIDGKTAGQEIKQVGVANTMVAAARRAPLLYLMIAWRDILIGRVAGR